jgi:hypothetical protein
MKNKIVVYVLFFVCVENLLSDEPPLPLTEFKSQNGKYLIELIKETNSSKFFMEEWALRNIETNEIKYYFECYQFSLSGIAPGIFISNNGENIVFVNWFLGVNSGINWHKYQKEPIENSVVLRFYCMGEEIKRYSLSDVFNEIDNGIQSESHLQWTRFNYDKSCIRMDNDKLIITTLELYEYTFNINNGEMIRKIKL